MTALCVFLMISCHPKLTISPYLFPHWYPISGDDRESLQRKFLLLPPRLSSPESHLHRNKTGTTRARTIDRKLDWSQNRLIINSIDCKLDWSQTWLIAHLIDCKHDWSQTWLIANSIDHTLDWSLCLAGNWRITDMLGFFSKTVCIKFLLIKI